jgi:hypothetical protein
MASHTPTAGASLTRVPTATLESLLRSIFRQRLLFPLSRATLIAGGFGNVEAELGALQGLDARAAQAVIVAAIAERRAAKTQATVVSAHDAAPPHLALVRAARQSVFVVAHDPRDAAFVHALASCEAHGAHRAWVLAHADDEAPVLPGLDVWVPPAHAPHAAACLIVDAARVLFGAPVGGPAVRVDDVALARELTLAWRARLADEAYSLRTPA